MCVLFQRTEKSTWESFWQIDSPLQTYVDLTETEVFEEDLVVYYIILFIFLIGLLIFDIYCKKKQKMYELLNEYQFEEDFEELDYSDEREAREWIDIQNEIELVEMGEFDEMYMMCNPFVKANINAKLYDQAPTSKSDIESIEMVTTFIEGRDENVEIPYLKRMRRKECGSYLCQECDDISLD